MKKSFECVYKMSTLWIMQVWTSSKKIIDTLIDALLGDPEAQHIRNIFFCNSEQIRLARRFVGSIIYETDATFNTNKLKMPLSVLVGILNTGKTFPFALCFITSESAATFEFMEDQLDEIFFHNCERSPVVCLRTCICNCYSRSKNPCRRKTLFLHLTIVWMTWCGGY